VKIKESTFNFVVVVGVLVICGTLIARIAYDAGVETTRKEAIKAGVGEYFINKYQHKQFRWIQNFEEVNASGFVVGGPEDMQALVDELTQQQQQKRQD